MAVAMAAWWCSGEMEAANVKFAGHEKVTSMLAKLTRTLLCYRLDRLRFGAHAAATMVAQRRKAHRCNGGRLLGHGSD